MRLSLDACMVNRALNIIRTAEVYQQTEPVRVSWKQITTRYDLYLRILSFTPERERITSFQSRSTSSLSLRWRTMFSKHNERKTERQCWGWMKEQDEVRKPMGSEWEACGCPETARERVYIRYDSVDPNLLKTWWIGKHHMPGNFPVDFIPLLRV